MSYVINVTTSVVSFTPPSGAETAFAGQAISSATWNATFTDICNNGLAVVGESPATTIKGNAGATNAVVTDLTPQQVQALIHMPNVAYKIVVSFSLASTDNPIALALPTGFTEYQVNNCILSNASANLTGATVALYTAAAAGGTALITASTVVTVSTSGSTNNNMQIFNVNNQSTQSWNVTPLYFRTGLVTATGTGTVTLFVRPIW